MDNKELYNMKLHDELAPSGGGCRIKRVPGGWVYRFWESENKPGGEDGQWSENYRVDSVFVPLNSEFKSGEPN